MKRYIPLTLVTFVMLLTGCQKTPEDSPALSLEEKLVNHDASMVFSALPGPLQKRPHAYAVTTGQSHRLVINTDSLFEPNSATYRPGYLQTLQPVMRELLSRQKEWRHLEVLAFDNADHMPSRNLLLTEQQAEKVAAYLWFNHIPGSAIHFKGMGGTDPVSDPQSLTGRVDNHRLEIVMHPSTPGDPS